MTTPRSSRPHHDPSRHHDAVPSELPAIFAGDAHEPDRDALAWLAAGRLEAEAPEVDERRHRRRELDDAGWDVVAPALADAPDADLTAEFWGDAPRWRDTGERTRAPGRSAAPSSTPAPKQRWRRRPTTPVSTGTFERTRTHHVVERGAPRPDDVSGAERADDGPYRSLPGRLGAIAVIALLIVPVAIGLRSATSSSDLGLRTMAVNEMADLLPVRPAARATPGMTAAPDPTSPADPASDASEPAADAEPPMDDAPPVQEAEQASLVDTSCALEYTVAAGDYWLRLADEAGVELASLLAVNGATIETPLHPGDDICLPDGATRPSPPPTSTTPPVSESASAGAGTDSTTSDRTESAPPSTAAPATTTAPATVPPTTAPATTTTTPPTTAPATTAPAPVGPNPSEEQVRAIIREVWPEDQHDTALTVARRESRFRADAYNGWCCHGIFQIHWQAHRSWLQGQGITSSSQLYDARTNIELAYQIYQRAGGWGPWSQTAY